MSLGQWYVRGFEQTGGSGRAGDKGIGRSFVAHVFCKLPCGLQHIYIYVCMCFMPTHNPRPSVGFNSTQFEHIILPTRCSHTRSYS